MEPIIKHRVESRRTDKYSDVKQNLFSASNAVHTYFDGTEWESKFADGLLEK